MGSSTYMGGSHLRFDKLPIRKGEKLHRYNVVNSHRFEFIGMIHWRGGWRQYVFKAEPEVDMSRSCMKEVSDFISKIMKEWRMRK